MPELPEVETAARGLRERLVGRTITGVDVRDHRLRWPVDAELGQILADQRVITVWRRAKYLLVGCENGSLIIHLGMSGSLQVVTPPTQLHRHDHVVWAFADPGKPTLSLRLRDHRRFGAVLWTTDDPLLHPLLRKLGPEPLGNQFGGDTLYDKARGKRISVKAFLMDARVVAGIGNIYATEALYRARIHPSRPAGRIALKRFDTLAAKVRDVLQESIGRGGTTLRDFTGSDGSPGYFVQDLAVYGRAGLPCRQCGMALKGRVIAQRSTVFCGSCQR
jgi:formamidopyrimidine-DNA glycosylase